MTMTCQECKTPMKGDVAAGNLIVHCPKCAPRLQELETILLRIANAVPGATRVRA